MNLSPGRSIAYIDIYDPYVDAIDSEAHFDDETSSHGGAQINANVPFHDDVHVLSCATCVSFGADVPFYVDVSVEPNYKYAGRIDYLYPLHILRLGLCSVFLAPRP